ncbi:MAG: sugar phosphate isomerase/epimerase [Acidobacteriia bacterium]|jgi:D-psicose/D-tagatose/L-ribulose 3-epimerase|nr:sugar phosphate isomerase/epimerase [Terriglobia bacterium]
MNIQLCLFSSTPDMADLSFVVKVLTGTPVELAQRAVAWGYDGIEFMPDPLHVPDPREVDKALKAAGALMPVVNTGRMFAQGMALLHADALVRKDSSEAFKRILDFAGHFKARVGLGAARGAGIPGANREEMDRMAEDVFRELAAHAEKVQAVIMLEPADPGVTSYINTMDEAMAWVERIGSPAFSVMLDTYQLAESEPSLEHGIRAARGQARHIHLYDPSRWPPGVLPEKERLDWPHLARVLRQENFQGSGSVVLALEGDPEPAARKAVAYLRRIFEEGEQP